MARAGRKRRQNVRRYPKDGSIVRADRGESEEQILSVAKWQREKIGATNDNWREQEWGSPLGRLRQAGRIDPLGGISDAQHAAIKQYALVRHRYMVAMGFPPEHPRCIAGDIVGGQGGAAPDMEDDEVFKRRRAWADVRSHLLQYQGRGVEWCRVLDKLATDQDIDPPEIGQAREAANLLVHLWKIG